MVNNLPAPRLFNFLSLKNLLAKNEKKIAVLSENSIIWVFFPNRKRPLIQTLGNSFTTYQFGMPYRLILVVDLAISGDVFFLKINKWNTIIHINDQAILNDSCNGYTINCQSHPKCQRKSELPWICERSNWPFLRYCRDNSWWNFRLVYKYQFSTSKKRQTSKPLRIVNFLSRIDRL